MNNTGNKIVGFYRKIEGDILSLLVGNTTDDFEPTTEQRKVFRISIVFLVLVVCVVYIGKGSIG